MYWESLHTNGEYVYWLIVFQGSDFEEVPNVFFVLAF